MSQSFYDPDDARAAHEAEQMHAKAMERLRQAEDFVLFTFEPDKKGWHTSAAVGKHQDLDTMQFLVQVMEKHVADFKNVIMATVNKTLIHANAADWKTMDDEDKTVILALLIAIVGPESANRLILEMEQEIERGDV
jgi:hypothetical protein